MYEYIGEEDRGDDWAGSNVVKELHVDLGGQILGLAHESLEVLASPVLGGGDVAALVVVLLEHDDGVGIIAAATGDVSVAVGLLVRVGTCGDLVEQLDDLVGLGGTLGLDAVRRYDVEDSWSISSRVSDDQSS